MAVLWALVSEMLSVKLWLLFVAVAAGVPASVKVLGLTYVSVAAVDCDEPAVT